MRILVIGSPEAPEHHRLKAAAAKLGHRAAVAPMRDVRFSFGKSGDVPRVGRRRIDRDFDVICFRSVYPFVSESLLLAEWCAAAGLRVVDERLARRDYVNSKAYEAWKLRSLGLPAAQGFQPLDRGVAARMLRTARFPLVAKGVHGSKGRQVHLCRTRREALDLVRTHPDGFFMFQPFIDVRDEYRVLILGGRMLGAMRKRDIPGDFRRNVALGGAGEPAKIPPELRRMCEKAARALGHDIAGVDLAVTSHGMPCILEVNRAPGFAGFEKATGIDVAERIIGFLTRR